jgi:molybdopterin-guanine dinucleotide biosynthesis protein B
MIPILAVVGTSNTGKTTLIEFITSHLSKEGVIIGTIKHIHHAGFTFDTEGKDSWRHSKAGAKIVICIAPEEIAIIKKDSHQKELDKILDLVKNENLDLLIIEGFHSLIAKRADIHKIIIGENEEDVRRTLNDTIKPILAITGPLAKKKVTLPEIEVPIINFHSNGEEILSLVKNIL